MAKTPTKTFLKLLTRSTSLTKELNQEEQLWQRQLSGPNLKWQQCQATADQIADNNLVQETRVKVKISQMGEVKVKIVRKVKIKVVKIRVVKTRVTKVKDMQQLQELTTNYARCITNLGSIQDSV